MAQGFLLFSPAIMPPAPFALATFLPHHDWILIASPILVAALHNFDFVNNYFPESRIFMLTNCGNSDIMNA